MDKLPQQPLHPETRIGHVHLKVSDIPRSLAFYRDVLGFEVTQYFGPAENPSAVFLSAGGAKNYHHHLALNTWHSKGGPPAPARAAGLYHVAILYPTRTELADALRRVVQAGIPIDGAADHGVSEAIYLRDPDGNGVELYRDKPREQWPFGADGQLDMMNDPLDLKQLLSEA